MKWPLAGAAVGAAVNCDKCMGDNDQATTLARESRVTLHRAVSTPQLVTSYDTMRSAPSTLLWATSDTSSHGLGVTPVTSECVRPTTDTELYRAQYVPQR